MFDVVVITAANAAQARGYREQVKWRRTHGLLPASLEVRVVPDPGGRRVGSLGATVNVLKRLGDLRGRRVFICHSGGDARRTPGYAAMGKAFTPLPVTGGQALFDLILANMAKLPMPKAGGVLVACGDVLITFDFASADLLHPGVTGVGFCDGAARAARHGVYQVPRGARTGCLPVTGFLQKPQFAGGRHIIDTGILWIDAATAAKMVVRGWKVGDLYQEFASALIEGFAPFHVNVARRCDFFHIGSSRELLGCMTAPSPTSKLYGFTVRDPNLVGRDLFVARTENIVTNLPPAKVEKLKSSEVEKLKGEPLNHSAFQPFNTQLSKGECLTYLPIGASDWVEVRYSIDDNFKGDGKWEKKLYRLGRRRVCLKELMPQVNHRRLLEARGSGT
jgi:hypothetical protein